MPILLILVIWTLLEIAVFVKVGAYLGAFGVVVMTLLTAMVGIAVVRLQGLTLLKNMQDDWLHGRDAMETTLDGGLLLLGGVLMLVPGFVSDVLGAILLIPWVRRWLVRANRRERLNRWGRTIVIQIRRPDDPW